MGRKNKSQRKGKEETKLGANSSFRSEQTRSQPLTIGRDAESATSLREEFLWKMFDFSFYCYV